MLYLGSLFTDATTAWNVAHLPSALSRLLPVSDQGLPGVNTPYLYFGMWRATFAWHVEDMDLFSINYIHFGAPKFWYAIPQGRSNALEQTMRSTYNIFNSVDYWLINFTGHFPKDTSQCPQFLRHKSFLASPTLLANSSCRPNHLVQQAGEFVITFPRGYHAGFNMGLNCAESVNFALESWLEIGRRAKACECISDRSVYFLSLVSRKLIISAAYALTSTNCCESARQNVIPPPINIPQRLKNKKYPKEKVLGKISLKMKTSTAYFRLPKLLRVNGNLMPKLTCRS